jgi:hypothetical protein
MEVNPYLYADNIIGDKEWILDFGVIIPKIYNFQNKLIFRTSSRDWFDVRKLK